MLSVAIDAGPLHGPRTGIGNAVAWTLDALGSIPDSGIDLLPYVTSTRAEVTPPQRRLPLPAAIAHRWWQRPSAWNMDRWLGRPDVVHGTNYVVPPTRVPRLVSVYDCWFLEHPEQAGPDVTRSGRVLRRAVADGAHVVTSSHATADRVRTHLGVEAVTVHLGPPPAIPFPSDTPRTISPALEADPFVLALGTVERRKNLPVLIAAFARLAAEHETVRLVVAGRDGDDSDALRRSVAKLASPVAHRVHRLSDVDEEAKHWLLHRATALAYPSLDEGFGFPILEAQLAETPVVASSAGSIPEISGSAALLSPPADVDALAANLHWVVTSDQQRELLIRLGRRNLDRFSWNSTAAALNSIYHELAEETEMGTTS